MAWYQPIGESQRQHRPAEVADRPQRVGDPDHRPGDPVHRPGARWSAAPPAGPWPRRPSRRAPGRRRAPASRRPRGRSRPGWRRPGPPRATLASSAVSRAAVAGACRPTAEARTSSSRPLSSSARVCRPMMNMLISPTEIAPKAVACQVTCPPMVLSARAGPAMAMKAALLLHARRGAVELLLGGVEPVDADRLAPVEERDAQAPPQQHPAVAPQERTAAGSWCRSSRPGRPAHVFPARWEPGSIRSP